MSRRQPAAATTAAARSLAELERWLRERAEQRPVATSMPMLDGYVAAIVAGPVSITPPDWVCPLLAIDADAFNRGGTAEFAAISAVVQHHNAISNTLSTAPQRFKPIFRSKPRRRGGRPPLVPGLLRRHDVTPAGVVTAALSQQPRLPPALARAAVLRRRPRPTSSPRYRCGCRETTSAPSS